MAIADRAAAFLGKVGAALPQSVTTASGSALEQMQSRGRQMGQATGQFLGNVGTATGAALSGTPAVGFYGNMSARRINPGGLLGSVGMKGAAAKLQAAYQDPRTAQMLGAGVLGAGAIGIGAVAGLAAKQHALYQNRKAGQQLGAQLGVVMPIQY